MQHLSRMQSEELPDGAFIAPQQVPPLTGPLDDNTFIRTAEYAGSFVVDGVDQRERADCVRLKLENMRVVTPCKSVLLIISLTGIKICNNTGESVLMAHALRRISYATCDPEFCQFSFLAREPKGQTCGQRCYVFVTRTPEQAEELNRIVGDAFTIAYAQQKQSSQPSFNDVIERQLQASRTSKQKEEEQAKEELNKRLRRISTPSAADLAAHRKEQRQKAPHEESPRPPAVQHQLSSTTVSSVSASPQVDRKLGAVRKRSGGGGEAMGGGGGLVPRPNNGHFPGQSEEKTGGSQQQQIQTAMARLLALHPALNLTGDPNDIKGHGSPVVAIKEHLDAEAAAQMAKSTLSLYGHIGFRMSPSLLPASTQPAAPASSTETSTAHPASVASPVASSNTGNVGLPHPNQSSAVVISPPGPAHNAPVVTSRATLHLQQQQQHSRQTSVGSSERLDAGGAYLPSASSTGGFAPVPMPTGGPSKVHSNSKMSYKKQEFDMEAEEEPPVPPVRFNSLRKYNTPTSSSGGVSTTQAIMEPVLSPIPSSLSSGPTGFCYDAPSPEPEEDPMPWYQPNIPREISLEVLAQEEIGRFIVRDSSSHVGCYALSVKVPKFDSPSGITHYLIQQTQRGVKLKGLDKEWPSLHSLVTHLTVMPELLPLTLKLPPCPEAHSPITEDPQDQHYYLQGTNNPKPDSHDPQAGMSMEEYQKLSDFSSMMADMENIRI